MHHQAATRFSRKHGVSEQRMNIRDVISRKAAGVGSLKGSDLRRCPLREFPCDAFYLDPQSSASSGNSSIA